MAEVRRRCVFYVSGFDPKGASHYHALYKEQSALQAPLNGLPINVGPRKRLPSGNPYWTLDAKDGESEVQTHYEFMRWDDIVRAHWPRHQWQLWRDVIKTTVFNLRHGALWKMYKLSWPPAVALFMPFVLLCAVLTGMPLIGLMTGWLAWQASASAIAAGTAGLAAAGLLGWLGRRLEARYSMYWMMRSYAFTAEQAQGRTPDLEARLDEQAARLAERLSEAVDDEVLVVGHSSGAIMAVSIVARALRLAPTSEPKSRPAISLLTLGQWIPLLGVLPQAKIFRAELAALAAALHLDWVDFSAPPDGCCFALNDPVASSGLQVPNRTADRPKLLSPRFAEMFDAPGYKALRRDKFRMHFQYLMASQRAADYDYFALTAGSSVLSQRLAGMVSVTDFGKLKPFRALVSL